MAKEKDGIENIDQVGTVLTKTEQYIENNQKRLMIIVAAIILIVGGYLGYKKLYLAPMEIEAHEYMFTAEQYFAKDSFNLALNGDGANEGFLYIVENYGATKAGNLANYYTGISYYNLGDFQKTLDYLNDYSSDDYLLYSIAQGAMGDASLELGKLEDALEYYKKAADEKKNNFTSPIYLMKEGFVLEKLNRWEEALAVYERIEKEYNRTNEGRKVEKYITRAKIKLNKQ